MRKIAASGRAVSGKLLSDLSTTVSALLATLLELDDLQSDNQHATVVTALLERAASPLADSIILDTSPRRDWYRATGWMDLFAGFFMAWTCCPSVRRLLSAPLPWLSHLRLAGSAES